MPIETRVVSQLACQRKHGGGISVLVEHRHKHHVDVHARAIEPYGLALEFGHLVALAHSAEPTHPPCPLVFRDVRQPFAYGLVRVPTVQVFARGVPSQHLAVEIEQIHAVAGMPRQRSEDLVGVADEEAFWARRSPVEEERGEQRGGR